MATGHPAGCLFYFLRIRNMMITQPLAAAPRPSRQGCIVQNCAFDAQIDRHDRQPGAQKAKEGRTKMLIVTRHRRIPRPTLIVTIVTSHQGFLCLPSPGEGWANENADRHQSPPNSAPKPDSSQSSPPPHDSSVFLPQAKDGRTKMLIVTSHCRIPRVIGV